MADKKISELTAKTSLVAADLFALVDSVANETKKITFANLLAAILPTGLILMWKGTIATIPAGWALCNGSGGTPDLRDKFIVGATQDDGGVAKTNITGSLTQSGGAIVTATGYAIVTDSGHYHDLGVGGTDVGTNMPNYYTTTTTMSANVSDSGHTHDSIPPYYALAFIMKT